VLFLIRQQKKNSFLLQVFEMRHLFRNIDNGMINLLSDFAAHSTFAASAKIINIKYKERSSGNSLPSLATSDKSISPLEVSNDILVKNIRNQVKYNDISCYSILNLNIFVGNN